MTAPTPDARLREMALEVAACRDEIVHCTHDLHTLMIEHDVQSAAYRIVSGERDEMRRCLIACAEALGDTHVGARVRRLLSRTTERH